MYTIDINWEIAYAPICQLGAAISLIFYCSPTVYLFQNDSKDWVYNENQFKFEYLPDYH